MAILPQGNLFSWKEIDASSDLERLSLVLSVIPDESFMRFLEGLRGKGRNDYPVRAMWNALLAGVVFQHPSSASLIRELRRNRELADLCGFDPIKGQSGVPSEDAFGRFLTKVVAHRDQLLAMFEAVVRSLAEAIPDLGTRLALDSKALPSLGRAVKDPRKRSRPDGRRDLDADWGVKTYKGVREDGSTWKKVMTWFGYKLHLVADSRYEVPLAFHLTRASRADVVEGRCLVRSFHDRQPEVATRAKELSADRGYDSGDLNAELYDDFRIIPVIDTRRMWKDGEGTRPLFPDRVDTIVYDERGQVSCVCPRSGEVRHMTFCGFEKDRKALKYRCPAAALGLLCKGRLECEKGRRIGSHGRVVRVPLDTDRRIFTPMARHSYRWLDAYKHRTAVERVFSRVDGVFGFEHHTIRGFAKMEARITLALLVNVCMALARVRLGQVERLRSLVAPLPRAA
jgi:hypothetical protein